MSQASVNMEDMAAESAGQTSQEIQRKGVVRTFVEHNKVGTAAFIVLGLILAMAYLGPLIMRGDNPSDVANIYGDPSWSHPLGFDFRGRDVFQQIVRGGNSIITVAAIAAILSTLISVVFGALAALLGGRFDTGVNVITDVVLTIPQIILLGVLAAFVRLDSALLLAFILAITGWPTLLRAVRSQVLSLKEREYVEAARMLDLGLPRILFREVLPNMASYIVINFVLGMTIAIYGQIVLYFLGLVALSGDNWGLMIQQAYNQGAIFFSGGFLSIMSPIFMIVLLQLCLVLISRSLEDVFNPRLREG